VLILKYFVVVLSTNTFVDTLSSSDFTYTTLQAVNTNSQTHTHTPSHTHTSELPCKVSTQEAQTTA